LALPAGYPMLEIVVFTCMFILVVFLSYLTFSPFFKRFKTLLSFLIGGSLYFIGLIVYSPILLFIFNIPFWLALAIVVRIILNLKAPREEKRLPKGLILMLMGILFYFFSYYLYRPIFHFLSNFWLWLFLAIIIGLILESHKLE